MKLLKSVVLIALFLILASQAFALSATLGNSRMILRPEITPGQETKVERSIFLKNANEFPVVVVLSVDEKYSKIISFPKKEYALDNNAEIDAPFTITLKEEGYYDIKIYVLFKPNDLAVKDSPVGLTASVVVITTGYTGTGEEGNETTTPTTVIPDNTTTTVTPGNNTPTTPAPSVTPTTIPTGGKKGIPSGIIAVAIILAVFIIGGIITIIILRKVW